MNFSFINRRYHPFVSYIIPCYSPFSHPPPKSLLGVTKTFQPVSARPLANSELKTAWGYQFRVQPLLDLQTRVSREFDLIWSLKAR